MEGLCGCDVDTICQGGDDQTGSVSKIFIGVPETSVSDLALRVIFFFDPVEFELGLPLELLGLPDIFVHELLDHVSGVRVGCDQDHDLLTHTLGQVTENLFDELGQGVHE